MYSGNKKRHALKFQAISTPDKIISQLAGLFEGKSCVYGNTLAVAQDHGDKH